ncbi:MAG TPA: hypothetical protein VLD17_03600 [Gemmatimonadaceae bacterium]|jgi:hypothetical protein|nr:hypothetical protein [Gemmatimonadaceae bacterium]
MAHLTPADYDALERAIAHATRVVVMRRGTEYVIVPRRLRTEGRREVIEATNPTTGDALAFSLDDIDTITVVR